LSGNHIYCGNTGNVGIGTTTPSTKLSILTSGNSFGLSHSNGVVSMSTYINTAGALLGTSTNHPLQFYTNNQSAQVTLLPNGSFGIGVASPQANLHINPSGAGSILIGTNKNTGGYTNLEMGITAQSNGSSFIQSTKASGSAYGTLQLNPAGGDVTVAGYVGIGTNTPFSPLDIVQTEEFGSAIRILIPGHVWGIGNRTNLFFFHNGIERAIIDSNDGSYTSYSDKRLKKNIEEISPVLDKVLQLKAKNYQFIDTPESTKKSTGFISQEVKDLFPEFVGSSKRSATDSTLYLTLNYAGFSVIAIKAIQERQVMINALRARVEAIEKKLK
jgi:trimeric autotransporter adhesin